MPGCNRLARLPMSLYGRYKLDFEKLIANLLYTIFVFLALYSAGYALDRLNKIHKNLDRLVKHPLPPVRYRRRLTFASLGSKKQVGGFHYAPYSCYVNLCFFLCFLCLGHSG